MRQSKKAFLFLTLVASMLMFSMIASAGTSSSTVTYAEDFQSPDVNGANPSDDFYTYSESGIQWMNVTNLTGSDIPAVSNQSFLMNTTTDTYGGALYDVVDRTYDKITLDVKIDNTSHNYTMITIGTWIDNEFYTGHGAFCYWIINTTNISFYVITTTDGNVTTEIYNESITNNTWYRLQVEFDYDDYTVTGKIYNEWGIAGVPILVASDSATCSIPFTNITQSFWAIPETLHGNDSCYLFVDDFTLYDTTVTTTQLIDDVGIGTYIVMLGLVILVLLIVVFMFQSGDLDVNFIIMLLLIFVLIAVTMGILFNL